MSLHVDVRKRLDSFTLDGFSDVDMDMSIDLDDPE